MNRETLEAEALAAAGSIADWLRTGDGEVDVNAIREVSAVILKHMTKQKTVRGEISELEATVIQSAVEFHCRREDEEFERAFHDSVSALIESRFQSVSSNAKQHKIIFVNYPKCKSEKGKNLESN